MRKRFCGFLLLLVGSVCCSENQRNHFSETSSLAATSLALPSYASDARGDIQDLAKRYCRKLLARELSYKNQEFLAHYEPLQDQLLPSINEVLQESLNPRENIDNLFDRREQVLKETMLALEREKRDAKKVAFCFFIFLGLVGVGGGTGLGFAGRAIVGDSPVWIAGVVLYGLAFLGVLLKHTCALFSPDRMHEDQVSLVSFYSQTLENLRSKMRNEALEIEPDSPEV